MQNTYCEFCVKPLLQHEFGTHFCKEMPEPFRASRRLEIPVAGKGTSVIKHTSDVENTSEERKKMTNYLRESCDKAVKRIYSRIEIEFSRPSTSVSKDTQNGVRQHVYTPPNDYSIYRPNLTEDPNKLSSLRNRDGAFSTKSQISNVPQANSEAGTSGNLKEGKYAMETPENSAVISNLAVQQLKKNSATAMDRMMHQMREQIETSNQPQETRTSVTRKATHFIYRPKPIKPMLIRPQSYQFRPSMGNRSLYATQENSEQALTTAGESTGNPKGEDSFLRNLLSKGKPQQTTTSGSGLQKAKCAEGSSGDSQGACSTTFLQDLLTKKKPQQAAASGPGPETAQFAGEPSEDSQGVCSTTYLQDLLTKKKPQQAAASGPGPQTGKFVGGPTGSSQGACSSAFVNDLQYKLRRRNFYCKLCKKNFGSWENVDRHVDRLIAEGAINAMSHKHSPHYRRIGFFVCVKCKNSFDTKYDLDYHWVNNHKVETPYNCIFCKMTYQVELYLSKHENTVHAGRTIFKCSECYKRFLSERGLEKHHCVP